MGDSMKRLLQRIVRRMPTQNIQAALDKWGRLTAAQMQSLDFTRTKLMLSAQLLSMCEANRLTMKHITELEMIYVMDNPNQRMWHVYQLVDPSDGAQAVELIQFRVQLKDHLSELEGQVSLKIKKQTDDAVWIRISWKGSNDSQPTYVVHYLQTPYFFVTGLRSKQKPLLFQAVVHATKHCAVKDANLSGLNFAALRDLLMRQYQQFPSRYPTQLPEDNQTIPDARIEREQSQSKAYRHHLACEAFGNGELPQLQSAVYKLRTKFRDNSNKAMSQREEPFRCVVKFSSANLLESLRHCVSSGIASTPVTPLLSSVPLRGRNHFVVTENTAGSSQPDADA
ncbi:centromere protein N [Synchiropus splendidus]|uniref:centromere protein N n=1 Tax=Synchiropus splendidus TaxID=270530 RepID=UPI00237EB72C|nr:centromere protein N [Synchiropus splendidus]